MSKLLFESMKVFGWQRTCEEQRECGSRNKNMTRCCISNALPTLTLSSSSSLRRRRMSGIGTANTALLLRPRAVAVRGRRVSERCGVEAAGAMRYENHMTEEAVKVMMLAQEESRRLGLTYVGTGQILLGLIGEGNTGIASNVLAIMGVRLSDARAQVEQFLGRGPGFVPLQLPFTRQANAVLQRSFSEALDFGHESIGSEHLLLSLLHEDDTVAARVLENLGVDPIYLRKQVASKVQRFLSPTIISLD